MAKKKKVQKKTMKKTRGGAMAASRETAERRQVANEGFSIETPNFTVNIMPGEGASFSGGNRRERKL